MFWARQNARYAIIGEGADLPCHFVAGLATIHQAVNVRRRNDGSGGPRRPVESLQYSAIYKSSCAQPRWHNDTYNVAIVSMEVRRRCVDFPSLHDRPYGVERPCSPREIDSRRRTPHTITVPIPIDACPASARRANSPPANLQSTFGRLSIAGSMCREGIDRRPCADLPGCRDGNRMDPEKERRDCRTIPRF